MNRPCLVFAFAFLTAGAGFTQNVGYAQNTPQLEPGPLQFRIMGPPIQDPAALQGDIFVLSTEMGNDPESLKNAPYTATAVTESTQTLTDGSHITNKSSAFLARDSQGRTRREETMQKMGVLNVDSPKVVLINDPVSHTNYVVFPAEQTVNMRQGDASETAVHGMRRKLETMIAEGGPAKGLNQAEREKPDVKHEDLGGQSIEGLSCQGRRETVTIPVGQIGNDRPIVITTEIWTSQDLHGIVLKKHSDPRFGSTEYRLTDIKMGEPDASLFQVPSGFKVMKSRTFTLNDKE
jgi:hypothetical protein